MTEEYKPPTFTVTVQPNRNDPGRFGRDILCNFASCGFKTTRWSAFDHHQWIEHTCNSCKKQFTHLPSHQCGGGNSSSNNPDLPQSLPANVNLHGFEKLYSLHDDVETGYQWTFKRPHGTLESAMEDIFDPLLGFLKDLVSFLLNVRTRLTISVRLQQVETGEIKQVPLISQFMILLNNTERYLESAVIGQANYCIATLCTYTMDGSNWALDSVDSLELDCIQYLFSRGGLFIKTPTELAYKGKSL
jgi:hypothetical protein